MISVLTLTYQRHYLLEEAIQSFLLQNREDCEMVIINDAINVEYTIDIPNVRIFNCKERFSSIGKKLEWGYKQCKFNYIYRLDDDDLLAPNALNNVEEAIMSDDEDFEIYRGKNQIFFQHNIYLGLKDNINNGNVYTKNYLNMIEFPEKSGDEDVDITFGFKAKIYTINTPIMIYRWGGNTLHISGLGKQTNEYILNYASQVLKENPGTYILNPHFKSNYYNQLK